MGYKLVALDIDGTIRNAERAPSDRTRSAVARVQRSGAAVTLATGRMFNAALEATKGLVITAPIITFQGAHIADAETGEVLWHRPLTPDMALEALDALDAWPGEVLAYHGDRVYANKHTDWVEGYKQRQQGRVDVVDDLRPIAAEELTRLVAVGEEEQVRGLSGRLSASFDSRLNIIHSLPQFCEILHPESGKQRALAWLCEHLGVPQDQTVAFANGYEDAEMVRWAGLGVAVEDGVPEVLEAADRVAPPLERDGVAQVLEELVDRGLVG